MEKPNFSTLLTRVLNSLYWENMNLRSKTVLEAAVKEYIKNGEPVSSKELAQKYEFGVKDATIRAELNRLTKEGFLEQPHTSGGRVPTDRGYQFFVGNTLSNVAVSNKILKERYGVLLGDLQGGRIRNLVEEVAGETHLLGVGQKEKDSQVYKSGLNDLFGQLDLRDKKEFQEIISDFELLDRRLKDWGAKLFRSLPEPAVYIGKKSPITRSENLSVILNSYDVNGEKVLIAVIGPKRMDYDKNLKLFKLLKEHGK